MLLYLTDDFLRAGTAVCPEAIYTDVLGFQKSEESLMGVCLMKTHIRVTIAVLDIDYLVTDNIYARPVAEELFVGRFCIILLRFKQRRWSKSTSYSSISFNSPGKPKRFLSNVLSLSAVLKSGLALVGSRRCFPVSVFLDGSEDGIRAAYVRRVGDDTRDGASVVTLHLPRMSRHEINAHQRTDYLAELISEDTAASLTQC